MSVKNYPISSRYQFGKFSKQDFLRYFRNENRKKFSNYKQSFEHRQLINDTQLSHEVWKTKSTNKEPATVWKMLG